MYRSPVAALVAVCLLLASAGPAAAEAAPDQSDLQVLRSAKLAPDGPSLLNYLRRLTSSAGGREHVHDLVRQLGDDKFPVREKASQELVDLGRITVPFLHEALKDPDLEIARRAERCLEEIDRNTVAALPSAVVRQIAQKKPEGAAEALLAYLPFAESEELAEEVRKALAAVALPGGKLDPVLKAALADREPSRRGAAAEALCQADAGQREAVLPLLKDGDPQVRLRAGLALARLREKQAVPVLIELFGRLPVDRLWRAEELLARLAGENAPALAPGDDEASRRKNRDAWSAWWQQHGAGIDLARLGDEQQLRGYTLVVLLDQGTIVELGRDNRPRWKFDGVQFPLDVQLLPGDRVLLAEQLGDVVTERNFKGEVLWKKEISGPLMAQRLPSGNTFIATRSEFVEVDRSGREVSRLALPDGDGIMRAVKLPNGEIACVTLTQRYVRLDPQGKELRTFRVNVRTSGGRVEVLPNGHVLVPQMSDNKVVEYDANGQTVWEVAVEQPIAAVRLPNGNTLATSMSQRRAVEYDRAGKEVWEYRSETRVNRALRR